jgi:hypothetical protein
MPKCSINYTAPNLPLNTNYICPVCKRLVHGICVGKHLEDQPLGRDIICLDCAKAESEDKGEREPVTATTDEDEGTSVNATVLDVSYKLNNIGIHLADESCSYKKKRGYKCVHVRLSPGVLSQSAETNGQNR